MGTAEPVERGMTPAWRRTAPDNIIPLGAAALHAQRLGLPLLWDTTIIVKQLATGIDVCLLQTAFNWRLILWRTDHPGWPFNGWCYTGPHAFGIALVQAQEWPDEDDGSHVPFFWYKNPFTQATQPEFLNR